MAGCCALAAVPGRGALALLMLLCLSTPSAAHWPATPACAQCQPPHDCCWVLAWYCLVMLLNGADSIGICIALSRPTGGLWVHSNPSTYLLWTQVFFAHSLRSGSVSMGAQLLVSHGSFKAPSRAMLQKQLPACHRCIVACAWPVRA